MSLAIVLAAGILTGPAIAAADGQLANPKQQKAAVTCQKVIAQVTTKTVATRLKALDVCATAAFQCAQTKQDDAQCLSKAASICTRKLAGVGVVATKAQSKIGKTCTKQLSFPALLSAEGLGLGVVAGSCAADFALDICAGIEPLSQCLVQTHDRAASLLYGTARPRTAELLSELPSNPPTLATGLPVHMGCGLCGASSSDRKQVELCSKAVTAAFAAFIATLEQGAQRCGLDVFECVQAKADKADCLPKARIRCDKEATKLGKAREKFEATIEKGCGAAAIDFPVLRAVDGLNLDVLGDECAAFAVPTLTSANDLVRCLGEQARCAAAGLIGQAVGRTAEFAAADQLGDVTTMLAGGCPVLATSTAPDAARTVLSASVRQFLRSVTRPRAGVGANYVRGVAPAPSTGVGRAVTVLGQGRITPGGTNRLRIRYRRGVATAGAVARQAAEPPTLVVTVQRDDVAVEDHFEIVLDPTEMQPGEVEDDLDVAYQATLPSCAFSLALAIRDDGVVSDYTPLLQVVDETRPTATPTEAAMRPTATPTPTPTPTGFTIGDRVRVKALFSLNVRDAPNGNVLLTVQPDARGTVQGGPVTVTANGFVWWEIAYDGGPIGWSAEGDGTTVFLERCAAPCTDLFPPFAIGDRVRVMGPQSLNVRDAPNGAVLRTVPPDVRGTVQGGPITFAGLVWWEVAYDTGATGWSTRGDGIVQCAAPCPDPFFTIGDRVRVRGPQSLNVRDAPNGAVLSSVPPDARGTVQGGPATADGLVWWEIAYDAGVTGWSARGDGTTVFLVQCPAPCP